MHHEMVEALKPVARVQSSICFRVKADAARIDTSKGREMGFPLQSKNLRRLNQVRSILYILMMVIGFAVLGFSLARGP